MKPDSVRVLAWPVIEPVTLAEVKAQVGLLADQTEHDAFLLAKMAAARRLIEQRLGITLVATQYRAVWKDRHPAVVRLPAPPLLVDADHELNVTVGGVAKAAGADFDLDQESVPGTLDFGTPGSGTLVVEFWGGVPPETRVCPMIRSAILLYVTHLFENRGVLAADTDRELPQAFETLLAASSWNGGW